MLSRVADSIYWMSRYLERAANTARFLEVSYHMNLDDEGEASEQWAPLVEITGDMKKFEARYGDASRENVMHFLMFNPEYPNSVANCLKAARLNARGLREILPPDLFKEINALGKLVPEATREKAFFHQRVFELCRQIKRTDMLISGVVSETMERGKGYYFWRLGEYLERADKTSRLLHVKYFHLLPKISDIGTPMDDIHWSALLLSLDAREVYHRTYGLITQENVIDMIVFDRGFPRAIYFCMQSALDSLHRITGDTDDVPHEQLKHLCKTFSELTAKDVIDTGINEFVDDLQLSLNGVNNAIFELFNTAPLSTGA
ncbi:alpha-E domain-containing protein [Pontiellaceae bacterium B12227]|nr:alpha-E domain-containing protein [Pontiellaceae bacterium B12227]